MAQGEKCRHCGKMSCYMHCQDSDDGIHIGDSKSVMPADGMPWVVDINCRNCGQSGSVRIDPNEIQWD